MRRRTPAKPTQPAARVAGRGHADVEGVSQQPGHRHRRARPHRHEERPAGVRRLLRTRPGGGDDSSHAWAGSSPDPRKRRQARSPMVSPAGTGIPPGQLPHHPASHAELVDDVRRGVGEWPDEPHRSGVEQELRVAEEANRRPVSSLVTTASQICVVRPRAPGRLGDHPSGQGGADVVALQLDGGEPDGPSGSDPRSRNRRRCRRWRPRWRRGGSRWPPGDGVQLHSHRAPAVSRDTSSIPRWPGSRSAPNRSRNRAARGDRLGSWARRASPQGSRHGDRHALGLAAGTTLAPGGSST